MTLWQAIILGVVQGLTEFLPISSTAHLRIVPALLGWQDPGAAFTAVIQLGTLLAVLIYFARDIVGIVKGMIGRMEGCKDESAVNHPTLQSSNLPPQTGWMIAAGTVPVVVLGLLCKHRIENNWRSLYVIAGAMIGMALVLALAEWLERRRSKLRE